MLVKLPGHVGHFQALLLLPGYAQMLLPGPIPSSVLSVERGQMQGDKSPHCVWAYLQCTLLALKATNIGHWTQWTITGLWTPGRGFAEDLNLVACSAAHMSRLLRVVQVS